MSAKTIKTLLSVLVLSSSVAIATPARADDAEIRRIMYQLHEARARLAAIDQRIAVVTEQLSAVKEQYNRVEALYLETGKREYRIEMDRLLDEYNRLADVLDALRAERVEVVRYIEELQARLQRIQGRG